LRLEELTPGRRRLRSLVPFAEEIREGLSLFQFAVDIAALVFGLLFSLVEQNSLRGDLPDNGPREASSLCRRIILRWAFFLPTAHR